jgi:hypothetical protein
MSGGAAESLIAARRRDTTRRRQRVLDALDRLGAAGQEISVSAVARKALLTELPGIVAVQEPERSCSAAPRRPECPNRQEASAVTAASALRKADIRCRADR